MRAADEFGKGLLGAAADVLRGDFACELYRARPGAASTPPRLVGASCRRRYTPFTLRATAPTSTSRFGHLDGYSAIYYTYMWSLVIAKDLFTRVRARGAAEPGAGAPLPARDPRAGRLGAPAAELVKDFLGREASFAAFAQWLDEDRH